MAPDQDTSFSRGDARTFYDRWGVREDWLRSWKDAVIRDLVEHARFDQADALVEFGSGTGRLAEFLLQRHLKVAARYLGLDVSRTMVALAGRRLAPFGARAAVRLTEGELQIAAPSHCFDRFLSTYVFDLLSRSQIDALLREAHRLLAPGGLVCLASVTHGATSLARLVERTWTRLHAWHPLLVGGCRPISLHTSFAGDVWRVRHRAVITRLGVSSEILIAEAC